MFSAFCYLLVVLPISAIILPEIPPLASDRKADEEHLDYSHWHSNVLSASLPRYWPPWGSHELFNFTQQDWEDEAKIDRELRKEVESSFSLAFYDARCHKDWGTDHVKFIPIYFWPGKTIELPCIMCFKAHVCNGRPKQWRVVPLMDETDKDFKVHKTPPPYKFIFDESLRHDVSSGRSPFWRNISWLERTVRMEKFPNQRHLMPDRAGQECTDRGHDYFCKGYDDYIEKRNIKLHPHLPVRPKFYQRDGKLIITHADPGVQGAYNCYDAGSMEDTFLVYFVQAMLPYYSSGPPIIDQSTTRLCNSSHYHSVADKFWQWHFAPSYLQNHSSNASSGEFNLRDTRPNKQDLENRAKAVRPWVDNKGETHATKMLNLDMFLTWSEWSNCTACFPYMGRKVREGHCNLRKRVSGEKIKVVNSGNKENVWVEDLNYILSIEPFKSQGVRVHGGLMSILMCSPENCYRWAYGQCVNSRLDYLYETFFRYFGSQYHKVPFYGVEDDQWKMCMNELRFKDDGGEISAVPVFKHEETYETLAAVGGYFFDVRACSRTDCD